MSQRAICRRCLLQEIESERPLYLLIREYIDSIPEAQRAGEALYRQRLSRCQTCERLIGGMCAVCGCYVEARAAKAGQSCPGTEKRW